MMEAKFYDKLEANEVQCLLCNHRCCIKPGKLGICGVRMNQEGTLMSLVYGRLVSQNIDPIEKKPLFHFYPGTHSFSIASVGCNFRCKFCQNSEISQAPRDHKAIIGREVPVRSIVEEAHASGCASISYTYTEPTIFMEYALDVAREAHRAGIRNVFVTNGYMSEETLEMVSPFLDAANVDLKAFNDRFYSEMCGAHLKPVLMTLENMKDSGIWVEVTTLIIPGLNDDTGELRKLARFLVGLGPETPWHVTAFYPAYQMKDRTPTPVESLRKARSIGMEAGLRYVYTGNIPGEEGENTYCHQCGALLIERIGYSTKVKGLEHGSCKRCGAPMAGVGLK